MAINKYLYGDLRCCKDFKYIFDKMDIKGEIYGENRQYKVKTLLNEDIQFIICSFQPSVCCQELENYGYIENKNFYYADKYFELLDFPYEKFTKNKKVYIWGAGHMGVLALRKLEQYKNIVGFIDSDINKIGRQIENFKIYSIDEVLKNKKNIFIIVSSTLYYFSIRNTLLKCGFKENIDFIRWEVLDNKPSDKLKKTFYDRTFYDFCCETFFRVFEVEADGNVSCCCTTLIEGKIGNLLYESYNEIWNSILHKIQCLSLCNRTFSFCIKTACPALIQRKSQKATDEKFENIKYKEFECRPEYLHLSIDETCNLFCESCRDNILIATGEKLEKTTILKNKILNDVDNGIRSFFLAGNGEVFLSKTYEEIWKSQLLNNAETIRILSNGMLFTEKRWNDFYKGKENAKIWVYISIDAATKQTYEEIRRGGNFDVLMKNLKFISRLRKENKIEYFRINFVVQRKNYLEMEKFIELGIDLGVDNVFFTKILNWGTFTEEEFSKVSMMKADMSAPKPELAEILDKKIFKNKIVDLGTIQYARNRRLPQYIDNYYEWETRDWMEMNKL